MTAPRPKPWDVTHVRRLSAQFPITAIREIKILKVLNHKNVVRLKEIVTSKGSDYNQGKGSIYMVMEFCDHDLTGLTDAGQKFTVPQIKCYMKQLLEGLAYCHAQKVLHRDIKGAPACDVLSPRAARMLPPVCSLAQSPLRLWLTMRCLWHRLEPTHQQRRAAQARRFRAGSRLRLGEAASIHQSCDHALVPAARAPARGNDVRASDRHVVGWLHLR
mmetsp:Transcript_36510/g.96324  ORF Transcript_36510/g.96324 Transcript_36510/m.96324 type:complete len:217 (+) Transcript_36510:388-1038(+)